MKQAPITEYDYDANPRQREWSRQRDLEADRDGHTTTYERTGECSERVTWTNAKGEGFSWDQTWPCPLEDAPQIGQSYRILHDEWWVPAGGKESASRRIHAYEMTDPAPAEVFEP